MKKEEITLRDVLIWIVENSDNTEAIDKINRTTFPFTSKYDKSRQPSAKEMKVYQDLADITDDEGTK